MPLNGPSANVVIHDLDLHFQGETLYAPAIKIAQAADVPADLSQLAQPPPRSALVLNKQHNSMKLELILPHVCPGIE